MTKAMGSATYGTAAGLNLKGAVSLAGGGQLEDTLKLVMASPDRGNRFFVANALYGFKSDYPEINPATYLTAHADYAARTYLRDGNPYLNPFSPFEASMNTSGDPQYTTFVWGQGFVTHPAGPNLGWPLVPFSVPSIAPTQYYTPFASLMGLAYESEGLGPFGPYSIPEPEKDIRSCGYDLPHLVFQQLPANDFLKLPVANWDAGIKAILAANSLGTVGTSVPINYITGDADPLNPLGTQVNPSPGTAWASFAKLCQAGDSVEMNIYGADHSSVVLESLEDVEAWVVDRFADVPATDEC